MTELVRPDSLVTLHYRLSTADGTDVVATFGATPATLQLGNGELAPPLEACLTGLPVGAKQLFTLEPGQAFGAHNPDLARRIPLDELPDGGEDIVPLTVVEFSAPNGGKFAGLVREIDGTAALIDFNHPLAGKLLRFEVEIIGVI